MDARRCLVVLVVIAWFVMGPLAMAFDGCAVMGAMCEGPCGISSCAVFPPGPPATPAIVAYLDLPAPEQPGSGSLTALEPPPKLPPLAA